VSFTERQSESEAPAVPVRVRQGAKTNGRDSVVSGSLAVDRTHVGGAEQRRHRRQIANVFFAAQGMFTILRPEC
jgi:hypothetical protein